MHIFNITAIGIIITKIKAALQHCNPCYRLFLVVSVPVLIYLRKAVAHGSSDFQWSKFFIHNL